VVLDDTNWPRVRRPTLGHICITCEAKRLSEYYFANRTSIIAAQKEYARDNPQVNRAARKRYRASPKGREVSRRIFRARVVRLRHAVFVKLGGPVCVGCGCDDERILEINHKDGGGSREHETVWKGSRKFLTAILRGIRSTADLNVMCGPCNRLDYLERRFPDLRGKITVRWTGTRG